MAGFCLLQERVGFSSTGELLPLFASEEVVVGGGEFLDSHEMMESLLHVALPFSSFKTVNGFRKLELLSLPSLSGLLFIGTFAYASQML